VSAGAGRRVIVILGMHRSGTSCLTGSLERAGLQLGEVHTWNRYNRRGNRENQAIVDFNDALLAANDGAWDRPPPALHWSDAQCREARELAARIAGDGPVGFKDPRTLLTLDCWRTALPELEFVGVFRHPAAVARSLQQRSDMPTAQALALWSVYNRRLLSLQGQLGFPLIDFDAAESEYLQRLETLAGQLGLDAQAALSDPFFDDGLRTAHRDPVAIALPYRVKLLHWRLRRRSARQSCP